MTNVPPITTANPAPFWYTYTTSEGRVVVVTSGEAGDALYYQDHKDDPEEWG